MLHLHHEQEVTPSLGCSHRKIMSFLLNQVWLRETILKKRVFRISITKLHAEQTLLRLAALSLHHELCILYSVISDTVMFVVCSNQMQNQNLENIMTYECLVCIQPKRMGWLRLKFNYNCQLIFWFIVLSASQHLTVIEESTSQRTLKKHVELFYAVKK